MATTIRAIIAASLLVLALGQAQAREAPLTDEERTVVQVYEAPGTNADQLYASAREWATKLGDDAAVSYESRQDGVFIAKGTIPYVCKGGFSCHIREQAWSVGFTVRFEAKDGRFRLSFTDLVIHSPPYNNMGMHLPPRDDPLSTRADLESMRPKLLELGTQLAASTQADKQSW